LTVLLSLHAACLPTQARETTPPEQADPAEQARISSVVEGNTAFALDLYRQLREQQEGNLFCSPYSVSTALAMTWAGARTETEQQMAQALRLTLDQDGLHPAYRDLAGQLDERGESEAIDLTIANRLWGQVGDPFLPDFIDLVQRDYAGGFEELDFITNADRARRTINDWVERQTRDRIKDLLQPGDIDASTTLVLTNAVYFKGDWSTQFDPDHTRDGRFFSAPDTAVTTPLMQISDTFGYFENDELQLLELPYEGEELSMVVLLPRTRDGLAALEQALTDDNLSDWLAGARRRAIDVTLPRFEMTSRFSLKDTLSAMGMGIAFTDRADFTGLNSSGDIFLADVIHKAWVKVNEEGTEAAAATAVVGIKSSIEMNPSFRADHPFVFMIRDRATGSILFLGRVVDPTA
jgi:serpin B